VFNAVISTYLLHSFNVNIGEAMDFLPEVWKLQDKVSEVIPRSQEMESHTD
jgi:hypothetical protein